MKPYLPEALKNFYGKMIMYKHIAGDTFFGPVRCITYASASDKLIVTGDPYTGRTYELLMQVTLIKEASDD